MVFVRTNNGTNQINQEGFRLLDLFIIVAKNSLWKEGEFIGDFIIYFVVQKQNHLLPV